MRNVQQAIDVVATRQVVTWYVCQSLEEARLQLQLQLIVSVLVNVYQKE